MGKYSADAVARELDKLKREVRKLKEKRLEVADFWTSGWPTLDSVSSHIGLLTADEIHYALVQPLQARIRCEYVIMYGASNATAANMYVKLYELDKADALEFNGTDLDQSSLWREITPTMLGHKKLTVSASQWENVLFKLPAPLVLDPFRNLYMIAYTVDTASYVAAAGEGSTGNNFGISIDSVVLDLSSDNKLPESITANPFRASSKMPCFCLLSERALSCIPNPNGF